MMKISKSLSEVWKWKDAICKETKNMTTKELGKYIRRQAKGIHKKYNLPVRGKKLLRTDKD